MLVQWLGHHEAAGTLIPYLMQKNLFELFALSGGRDTKTLGISTYTRLGVLLLSLTPSLAPLLELRNKEPPGEISTT